MMKVSFSPMQMKAGFSPAAKINTNKVGFGALSSVATLDVQVNVPKERGTRGMTETSTTQEMRTLVNVDDSNFFYADSPSLKGQVDRASELKAACDEFMRKFGNQQGTINAAGTRARGQSAQNTTLRLAQLQEDGINAAAKRVLDAMKAVNQNDRNEKTAITGMVSGSRVFIQKGENALIKVTKA